MEVLSLLHIELQRYALSTIKLLLGDKLILIVQRQQKQLICMKR